jgi:hypothetical protein
MTKIKIENKEVALVKTKVDKAFSIAEKISIRSDDDYKGANETLTNIRLVAKAVDQQKRKQLDPANATVSAIRDFWRPLESRIADAERVLKGQILGYKQRIDARLEQKEATISKKVEEGSMSFEKAVEKVVEIQATPTTYAGVKTRKIKKVEFTPLAKMMPTELHTLILGGFIVWNETTARSAALAGQEVPGTRVYEEEIIS